MNRLQRVATTHSNVLKTFGFLPSSFAIDDGGLSGVFVTGDSKGFVEIAHLSRGELTHRESFHAHGREGVTCILPTEYVLSFNSYPLLFPLILVFLYPQLFSGY